ncbi:hypothetical protein [Halopiger goleimassiliensis]|uniref:hypothetical protein n=1 Tax=Halopiger goleimassiliensis TaxID=1293048 RepID=UPI0006780CB2|nr:hypothetical protein [Halopiger goleimassiliensis]
MDESNQPERPLPDADSAEIVRWMEEDFGWAIAEAAQEHTKDEEHEAVEVEIINHDQGKVVGTIDTNGNLDTESDALHDVSQEYLEEGVPVLVPTTYENGETVHADAEIVVDPGTEGFVRAFVDALPSPYDCDSEVLVDLLTHDKK